MPLVAYPLRTRFGNQFCPGMAAYSEVEIQGEVQLSPELALHEVLAGRSTAWSTGIELSKFELMSAARSIRSCTVRPQQVLRAGALFLAMRPMVS